ncbi:LLM class flavin-dependent oxidoreductase [Pseudomonas moorei]|uniref:Luciferase-type oxidoreductase, BA3436 family n=2 Tax=Pseudomonas moorei TaxID=395599 RepID=A0A1H1CAV6_9PSED|nr:luciferase-type oxidoreductase, BA3436 family [Pseudomonas moorei]
MHPRFQRLLGSNGFSIGLELPLDNDWSSAGQRLRMAEGRPFGVPDLKQHAAMARLADKSGFRALWVRDVPIYDPNFGDAAQVFETFSYLGYLAGITENIMLGTAAVVLPMRQPWLTLKSANSVDELSEGRLLLGVASGDRPMELRNRLLMQCLGNLAQPSGALCPSRYFPARKNKTPTCIRR